MDTPSTVDPIPAQRPKHRLTIDDVRKAKQRGLSQRKLAAQHGVSRSAIRWLIDKHREEKHDVSEFKVQRADILAQLQSKSIALQAELIEDLRQDRLLGSLTPAQKGNLLHSLVVVSGTAFDKERLERGQSTANISTISRMVDARVSNLYKRSVTQQVVSDAQHNDGQSVTPQEDSDNSKS